MIYRFFFLLAIALTWGHQPAAGAVIDLNNRPDGLYSPTMLGQDFNTPPWNNGVTQGRASIVSGADAFDGKTLRILYPQGEAGPVGNNPPFSGSGAQWRWEFDDSYDEMIFEYKVMFADDFDFVLGGKLPGFVGGTANTGGSVPNGLDGWSARMMWEGDSDAIQYVYHPDQPGAFGDIMPWNVGGQRKFIPGTWHTIRQRVVMNTPTQNDGIIQGWFDGELAMDRQDIRFRDTDAFAIDTMYFSSFFGGSTAVWAPSKDEFIFFDDFLVTTSLADFNTDLVVDGADLAAWESGFGVTGDAELADGDGDRDLDVDGADFLFWQREVSGAGALQSLTAIPEPSTGMLVLLGSLISSLIGVRHRTSRRERHSMVGRMTKLSRKRLSVIPAALLTAIAFLWFASSTSAQNLMNVPSTTTPRFSLTGLVWPSQVGDGDISIWKDDQLAAASLTIDDNFQVDHPWWITTADNYDVRLTWFVISDRVGTGNPAVNGSWPNFSFLDSVGHDIQSHTVDHFPNFPAAGPLTLETNYTQAITDIEDDTHVAGPNKVSTLAYPFGLQPPNDKALAAQHYIAARGVVGTLNKANLVDYLNVNSLSTDNYGAGFPIPGVVPDTHFAYVPKLLDPTKSEYRGWLSVHSHGLTTAKKDAVTGLLDYLTATPGEYWIAPFTDIAKYGEERDTATLVTNVIGPEEIQFTLTDQMIDTFFDAPLTVKIRVDNSWTDVVATQGGQPLPAVVVENGGDRFALVNTVPDLGVVSLTQLVADPNADFDVDSDIDGLNFLDWQRGFGIVSSATLAQGDANADGTVDASDLAAWESQFGTAAAIGAAVVPEPASAFLLLGGAIAAQMMFR